MEIKFYNTPEPEEFKDISHDRPNFLDYRPDFALLEKLARKFSAKKKLIVIGHGGSITTFAGLYGALKAQSSKQAFLVSTNDPDFLAEVKTATDPSDTVVVAVSKSGETVTQLEALLQFTDYPLIVVTGVAGPLAEIATKLSADLVVHPPIGGRFSGFTEATLLPAALCGFDCQKIYQGGQEWLTRFGGTNLAWEAASIFYQLEERGIVDVFMPIYSSRLFPFSNLIVQLCHESFGKDGKGQTYFAHEAPESQHHTNQRFFGGRKNIAGWFISSDAAQTDLVTQVGDELSSVPLKNQTLEVLNDIPLQAALQFEREATLDDAKLQNISLADLQLEEISEHHLGELIAFWQLFAIYSANLRGVDPFNQPEVEASKKLSFARREKYSGKL
jgi:glucose-6-phosphate isomerase